MRAADYDRRGPAREVLEPGEVPDPVPSPGQVRVRVAVSAVNPLGQQEASMSIPAGIDALEESFAALSGTTDQRERRRALLASQGKGRTGSRP